MQVGRLTFSLSNFGSPPVTTGTFTQTPIANGTYVNGTHWTYTFLCSQCILSDGTTFSPGDTAPALGWAVSSTGPSQRASPSSGVQKHSDEGQVIFDLAQAKNAAFDSWKAWAVPKARREFEA
jgi:hypothetical protein